MYDVYWTDEDILQEGWDAFREGDNDCPYCDDTYEAWLWEQGWEDAYEYYNSLDYYYYDEDY